MGRPDQFQTERLPGGVRYILPRRVLGKARYGGLVLAGFGLLVTLFMCLWMGLPMAAGIGMLRDGEGFGLLLIAFALLGLGGLIPGLGMVIAGLAIWSNRTQPIVEVRDGRLYAIEKLGPIRWKRKRPIDKVRRLTITRSLSSRRTSRSREEPEPIELFQDDQAGPLLTIEATGRGIKPLKIAPGYSAAVLRPLAEALAATVNVAGPARLFERDQPDRRQIRVVEAEPETQVGQQERDRAMAADQPSDSRIIVDRRDDGLTVNVPPTGIWKSSAGLFSFGLIWTVFCTVIFGGMAASFLFGNGDGPEGVWGVLGLIGFSLVFFGVGVGMLLAGWNMGKRRAAIDVVGNTLLFSEVAPLKTRQLEWASDDLRAIDMGPSGIESNDQPIMCLRIEPLAGKPAKLLTGRPEPELAWLAALLRVELQLGEIGNRDQRPQAGARQPLTQPVDSLIGVDRSGDRTTFAVPPRGFGKVWGMLLLGLVFGGIGLGVWIGVAGGKLGDGLQWSDLFDVGFITLWALIFGGGGAAMLIGSVILARRRHLIEVGRDMLAVERFGPFGRRRDEWPADQVAAVEVRFSGTTVGNHRYEELVIRPRRGRTCKIGNGRPAHELRWLAEALRTELELTGQSSEDAA